MIAQAGVTLISLGTIPAKRKKKSNNYIYSYHNIYYVINDHMYAIWQITTKHFLKKFDVKLFIAVIFWYSYSFVTLYNHLIPYKMKLDEKED